MCGGAFNYIEKKPWNYVMCPSIDKQIFCGGRCFEIQRKKNLEVCFMIT
jgi:hypothetical protein